MISRSNVFRTLAALALIAALAGAMDLLAASSASAQTGADNYKTLTVLGGVNRFDKPLTDVKSVQKWIATKKAQKAIGEILDKVGLTSLTPTVIDILTKASPDQLKETDFQPGGTLVWMSFRRGGGNTVDVVRNIRWGGKKPFAGYMFIIDDLNQTYTFIVPKPCSNISLVSSEPSREKARLDAERAARDKAEADRLAAERAAAERARLEAERKARAQAEADRLAKEKADADRLAKEKAEAERIAREKAEAERKEFERLEKVKGFFSALGGKERRDRDTSLCSALFGIKGGAEFKVSPNVKINPAVGVAVNFENTSYTALFSELEFNFYSKDQKTYFGTGIGVWDLTHSDWISPTLLLSFGQEMWNNGKHNKVYFTGEGRLFLNHMGDVSNNYMVWAGLRFVMR